ncbi:MAG: Trk system potassium transporter TrkA [Deltaproteobacteria bacterium]|jgi:trk system potassium uptake protein TrkA|nr:Trk system potassium transporter TrkA [Deltaproteobacteria bacterium]
MKVIVAGAGEVGFNISEKLSRERIDVVLIDHSPERLKAVADSLDVKTVLSPVSRPKVLLEAGLRESSLFVAVTGSDTDNVLACRYAQLLAPEVRRLARVRDSETYEGLNEQEMREGLGLTFIIDPTALVVDNIMDFMAIPGAGDVIDVSGGRLKLVGLRLPKHHPIVGVPLMHSLPREEGNKLLIAAIYRHHELLIPNGSTVLKPHDLLYLAATPESLPEVSRFFSFDWQPPKTIFIMGGGEVGLHLARRLEGGDCSAILIEQNEERCAFLSRELRKTVVIKGDATDQALLEDEGVGECDIFIAVGTDDEKNMISCLLARRLGARNTITRVNRFSYVPLVSAIGLEALVSARVAAVSAILKYVRKGVVVSVATLQNEEAEIIELEVPAASRIPGRKLMECKLPPHTIIAALLRAGEVIIPKGSTVIEAGDILAVVARSESVSLLEKALGAK